MRGIVKYIFIIPLVAVCAFGIFLFSPTTQAQGTFQPSRPMTLYGPATDGYINAEESTDSDSLIILSASFATPGITARYAVKRTETQVTTCDASFGTYKTAVPVATNLATDGVYTICASYTKSGSTIYASPLTVIRDTTPPTVDDTALSVSVTVGTPVTVSVTEIVTGAVSYLGATSSDEEILTVSLPQDSSTLTLTGVAAGNVSTTFSATDSAGNTVEVTLSVSVTLPSITFTTAPTLSGGASDGYINNAESTAVGALLTTPKVTPSATIQYLMKQSSTPITACDATFGTYTTTIPTVGDLSDDGEYYICIEAVKPEYTTLYSEPFKVTRDTEHPTVDENNLTHVIEINTPTTIELDSIFSGAVSYATSITPAAQEIFSETVSGPDLTLTGKLSGSDTITIVASDIAGNTTSATLIISVVLVKINITTPARLADIVSDGYISDTSGLENENLFIEPVIATEQVTVKYTFRRSITTVRTCDSATGVYYETTPTLFILAFDGNYYFCIEFTKQGYPTSYSKPYLIVRDTVAPVVNAEATLSYSIPVGTNRTINLDEIASGFSSFMVSTLEPDETVKVSSSPEDRTITITGISKGSSEFDVFFLDKAGNSTKATLTIATPFQDIISKTLPKLTGVATDGYIAAIEASQTSAIVTPPTTDPAQVTPEYAILQPTITVTSCTSSVGTYTTSIPLVSDFKEDGTYYICVRATKEAYNTLYYTTPLQVERDTQVFIADATNLKYTVAINASYEFNLDTIFSGVSTYAITKQSDTKIATVALSGSKITITGVTLGNTSFTLSGTDATGNTDAVVFSISTSNTRPRVPYITPAKLNAPADDGYISRAEGGTPFPLVTAPVSESIDYTVEYVVFLETHLFGGIQKCIRQANNFKSNIPLSSSLTRDGAWVVCTRLRKKGHADTYLHPLDIKRDFTPPIIANITDVSSVDVSDTNKLIFSNRVSARINDQGSGLSFYQTAIIPADSPCNTSVTGFGSVVTVDKSMSKRFTYTRPVTLPYTADQKACFKATDIIGNTSFAASGTTYKFSDPLSVYAYYMADERTLDPVPQDSEKWLNDSITVFIAGLPDGIKLESDLSKCKGCKIVSTQEDGQIIGNGDTIAFTLQEGDSSGERLSDRKKIATFWYKKDSRFSEPASFSFHVDKTPPRFYGFPEIAGLNGTWGRTSIPRTQFTKGAYDFESGLFMFRAFGFVDTPEDCNASTDTSDFLPLVAKYKEAEQHATTRYVIGVNPYLPAIGPGRHGKHLCAYLRDRIGNVTTRSTPILFDFEKPKIAKFIPFQRMEIGGDEGAIDFDLADHFSDVSPLTYTTSSSDTNIVTAEIVDETLQIRAVGSGGTTVLVWATDSTGRRSDVMVFEVSVGDTLMPSLTSAEIPTSGDEILLTFDEPLYTKSVPDVSNFSLSLNALTSNEILRGQVPTTYLTGEVTVSGATVSLPLRVHWARSDPLSISYTQPESPEDSLRDLMFNRVDAFSHQPVTVKADTPADTTPPAVRIYAENNKHTGMQTSGEFADRLFFSSDPSDTVVDIPPQIISFFYIAVDDISTDTAKETGVNHIVVNTIETSATCPTDPSAFPEDSMIHYTAKGASGEVAYLLLAVEKDKKFCVFVDDMKGNAHTTPLETKVIPIGLPDHEAPHLTSATFSPDEQNIILKFNEAFDTAIPFSLTPSHFSLDSTARDLDGNPVPFITEVSLSDSGDTIPLSLLVRWGSRADPTLSYTPPDTNPPQDVAENDLAAFSTTVSSPPQDPEEEDEDEDRDALAPSIRLYEENGKAAGLQTEGSNADINFASQPMSGRIGLISETFTEQFPSQLYAVSEDSNSSVTGVGLEYFLFKVGGHQETCEPDTITFPDPSERLNGIPQATLTIPSEQTGFPSFRGKVLCVLSRDVEGNTSTIRYFEKPSSRLGLTTETRDGYISAEEAQRTFNLITPPPTVSDQDTTTYALIQTETPVTVCDFNTFSADREDTTIFSRIPKSTDLTKDGDYYLCTKIARPSNPPIEVYAEPLKITRDTVAPTVDSTALTQTVSFGATKDIDLSDIFTNATTYTAEEPEDTDIATATLTAPTLTVTGVTLGTTTIATVAMDEAENTTSATITLTTVPADIIVTTHPALTGIAADGSINNEESSGTAVLLTTPTIATAGVTVEYTFKASETAITDCTATIGTYTATAPVITDLIIDGDYYLCVKYSKASYNDLYSTPLKLTRDTAPPEINPEGTTYAFPIGGSYEIKLPDMFNGPVERYAVIGEEDRRILALSVKDSTTLTVSTRRVGTTSVGIRATDSIGNSIIAILTITVTPAEIIVTTHPTLTGIATDGFINSREASGTTALLTTPTTTTTSVTVEYTTKQSDTAIATCTATTGTYTTVAPTAEGLTKDGDYYLCTKYSKANHTDLYSTPLKVTRDTVAPTADASAFTQTIAFGTTQDIDLSDIFSGAETYTAADPADTDIATATFTAPNLTITTVKVGTTTIRTTGTDEAGNTTTATITITITPAKITVTTHPTLAGTATDGFINSREASGTTALLTTPTTATAGVTVEYTTKQSSTAITACDATTGTYAATVPAAEDLAADGDYYLCTKYSRANHADLYSTPLKVTRDTTAPTTDSTALTQTIAFGVPRTLDLSDIFSGAETYTAADPADTDIATATFTTPNLAITTVKAGTTTIAITGTDEAGNTTTATITITITPVDITVTTHPTLTGIATDGFINSREASGTTALLTTPTITTAGVTVEYTAKQSSTTITACTATVGTYTTVAPTAEDFTADGDYYLCAKYSKTGHTDLYSAPLKITRDTSAPTVDNSALTYTITFGATQKVDLSDIFTDATTYTTADPAETTIATATFTAPNLTITTVKDGTTTIAITGADVAGNTTTATITITITPIDIIVATHPTLTGTAADGFINSRETSGTASLLTAPVISTARVVVEYIAKQSSTAITSCDSSVGTYTATAPVATAISADGDYYLCTKYSKTGHTDLYSTPLKVTRDTSAPTVDNSTLTYTITFGATQKVDLSDIFSGAETYTAADPADTDIATATFTSPTLTVTGVKVGTTTIAITGTDVAGNTATATITITVTPVGITVTAHPTLTGTAADIFINSAEQGDTTALLTTPEVSTADVVVEYTAKQSDTAIATCTASTGTYTTVAPTAEDITADGDYYLCTKYSKANHADLYSTPLKVTRDTTAPTADSAALAQTIPLNATQDIDLSDIFSGAETYTTADPAETTIATATFTSPTLTVTGVKVGATTIAITGTDVAGNTATATITLTVALGEIIVTTPPALPSPAADGFVNLSEAGDRSPLFISPTIATAGVLVEYVLKRSKSPITVCDSSVGTYQTGIIAISQLFFDDDYYICVKYSKEHYADRYSTPLKLTRDTVVPATDETALAHTIAIGTSRTLDLSDSISGASIYTTTEPADTTIATATFTSPNLTITGVAEGNTTIEVTATDEAENTTTATLNIVVAPARVELSGTAADGFINSAESSGTSTLTTTPTVSPDITITYASKQSDTAIKTCDASVGTYRAVAPIATDFTTDGDYYICVKYSRENKADFYSAPLKFTRDTVAPTIDSSPPRIFTRLNETLPNDLSKVFIGAATYTAAEPADTSVATVSISAHILSVTGVSIGTTTSAITATDKAGNSATTTHTIHVHLGRIMITTLAGPAGDAADGFINSAESTRTSPLLNDSVLKTAGVAVEYSIYQSERPIIRCRATTGTYTTTIPTAADLTEDGLYYVCARYTKQEYRDIYTIAYEVIKDTVAPTADETALAHTVALSTPLTLDLADIFDGATTYTATDPADTAIATATVSSPNLTITGVAEGNTTIEVTAADEAGNTTTATLNIVVAPARVDLSGTATDGFINSEESTKASAITTTPTVSTDITIAYAFRQSDTAVTTCDASVGTYRAVAPIATDFTTDGDHYICVKYSRENKADFYSAPLKVIRDTASPGTRRLLNFSNPLIGVSTYLNLERYFQDDAVTLGAYITNIEPADPTARIATIDYSRVSRLFGPNHVFFLVYGGGTFELNIWAEDVAGNRTVQTNRLTVRSQVLNPRSSPELNSVFADDGYINNAEKQTYADTILITKVESPKSTSLGPSKATFRYRAIRTDDRTTVCAPETEEEMEAYSDEVLKVSDLSDGDGLYAICAEASRHDATEIFMTGYSPVKWVTLDTTPPAVKKSFTNATIEKGDSLTLDLSEYFVAEDGLTYAAHADDDAVSVAIQGGNVVLTAEDIGSATITVSATDVAKNVTEQSFTATAATP